MPANMQSLSAVLKETYEPGVTKQINDDVVTLKRIERTADDITEDIGGKYAVFAIHTRRNSGIGARLENEALPVPGQQGTAAGRVNLTHLYGGIELTGQAFELANSKPEAFINAVDLEMDGLKADLAKDLNRQVYGNGSGRQATTTAASATFDDVKYLWLGGLYDVYASAGTLKTAGITITGINESTNTITFTGGTVTWASGDFLVRSGNYNKEWIGFGGMINDTGAIYNIDPANEPSWKSVVSANGGTGRSISETLLITTNNKVRKNGGSVTAMFAGPGVWTAYFNLLSQQRQFVNTKEFAGGFTGLSFFTDKGEIPFVQDDDAPAKTIYGINEKAIRLHREHDWRFMNRDGSMWQRKFTNAGVFDAYWAQMYQYSQLSTNRRNTHFVIRDVNEVT